MATGIIAEFNPFHNGHKYLIAEAKRRRGGEVVCVMSGSFVQRGEPAITDKHSRALAALENGADLVLELPVVFSLNTAQKFARGAVAELAASGVVDALAFGSESGDAAALSRAAELILSEPPEVSRRLRDLLSSGLSYPAARERAYEGYIPQGLLSSPNDILAVEYLRAARELGAGLEPVAIARRGAAHDGGEGTDGFASASELRQRLLAGESIARYAPAVNYAVYDARRLDAAVISALRLCGADYLAGINDVTEGLENRFIRAALAADTVDGLCAAVKSKRYPLSRIRRIAWSALLGITKEKAALPPSYIRVLGMNRAGAGLLRRMKTAAGLPVVVKTADFEPDEIFEMNCRAEDIFALSAADPARRAGGRELTIPPVVCQQ